MRTAPSPPPEPCAGAALSRRDEQLECGKEVKERFKFLYSTDTRDFVEMAVTRLKLEFRYQGQKLRGFNFKLMRSQNGYLPESSWRIAWQVVVPYLIAGLGMVCAGLVLDKVMHWEVFTEISQFLILFPALGGLKGDLEMTLCSRLSTAVNTGQLDTPDKLRILGGNLALLQVQATGLGSVAALISLCLGAVSGEEITLDQALVLSASSITTASIATVGLGLMMISVILCAKRARINPDNVATPIAASLGDLITLSLLAGISNLLYTYKDLWYVSALVILFFLILVPPCVLLAQKVPQVKEVLRSGWQPILGALCISSLGGLILDKSLSSAKFERMAVYTPVFNGVGGNLVAVQASRISTYLHILSLPGALPSNMSQYCPNPCKIFFSGSNSKSARVLLLLVVPGHLIFLYTISLLQTNSAPITASFAICYLCAALLQVAILLYAADLMTRVIWRRSQDPDNISIPYLTALGDLLGTGFLALCFYLLFLLNGPENSADSGSN